MPRKTSASFLTASKTPCASMRPRPDAAENVADLHEWPHLRDASMRPRPDAAENPCHVHYGHAREYWLQ